MRPKFVYFHIDEKNRDALTAVWLKDCLRAEGLTIIFGNRLTSRLLVIFERFFSAVILPKPHFYSTFLPGKKPQSVNSVRCCLYTENIGIIASRNKSEKMVLKGALDKEFMEGDLTAVNDIDLFFFWGQKVASTVTDNFPELKSKVRSVGHPRHHRSCFYSIKSGLPRIGLVTRHCTVNDYKGRQNLPRVLKTYASDEVRYEYQNLVTGDALEWKRRSQFPEIDAALEYEDAKNLMLIMKKLCTLGMAVELKIHPRENHETWKSAISSSGLTSVTVVDVGLPMSSWVSHLDCLIGPPSTSFYDACLSGIPVCSIHGLRMRKEVSELFEENNDLMPFIFAPGSMEELVEWVLTEDKSCRDSDGLEEVLKAEAGYPNQNGSLARTATEVKKAVSKMQKSVWYTVGGIIIFLLAREFLATGRYVFRLLGRPFDSADFPLGVFQSHSLFLRYSKIANEK